MNAPNASASPINQNGGVAPVPIAKDPKLGELKTHLSQVTANSTASYIGKIAFRGHELGVSQTVTMGLLKDYFTNLGYDDLRPLRIAHFVKGCYRWAKDHEEASHDCL
jgi:hypothetical protein